ncbi:MAG: hypothetical protein JW751_17305 [Polyangiaceae bacterium]|nr:hypothetical protein [Polyangiaceae bacterium]
MTESNDRIAPSSSLEEPSQTGGAAAAWPRPAPLTPFASAMHLVMNLLISSTLVIACLIPLHVAHTRIVPLPFLEQGRFFEIPKPASFRLGVGDEIPLYRFHEELHPELARARVIEADATRLRCEVTAGTTLFAPGRHGLVVQRIGDLFSVDMGIGHGLQPGEKLALFKDWERVGELVVVMPAVDGNPTLTRLGRHHEAKLQPILYGPPENVTGLVASEYTVPTTLVLFSGAPWLVALEIGAFAIVLALELHLFFRRGHGFVAALGRSGQRAFRRLPQVGRRGIGLLFSVAASGALYAFIGGAVVHFPRWLGTKAANVATWLAWGGPPTMTRWVANAGEWLAAPAHRVPASTQWVVAGLLLAAHLACLLFARRHLPLVLWHTLRYEPRWIERRITKNAKAQLALVWVLHLAVLYAFAYTLVGFLAADFNRAFEFMCPADERLRLVEATLARPTSIAVWIRATIHNVRLLFATGIAPLTFDQWLSVLRYFVWGVTVIGCLVGYVHSFLHALHLTTIRNIDFTLLGWFTNAICYGPLLAGLLWAVVPWLYGPVPTVAAGPLHAILGVAELAINVAYAASIFNMGTKFGVMVDKGLVDTGFYSVIRHPSYTLEGPMLFLVAAKSLGSGLMWVGAAMPFLQYWLRSEREDVFMSASNPEYPGYCARVPYKFIRGLV